jgi:L-fuconolactonase
MSMTVDAHNHFWRYTAEEYGWIRQDMERIRRDFLPDDLLAEIRAAGVDGTVAVQARQTAGETKWLLELAEQYDFIKGVVGWAPFLEPCLEEEVASFLERGKLKGLRHVIHDEPDPNFILHSDFNAGIDKIQKFGLVYDILIFERHLPQTIEFVDRHPNQVFVVDHIAKPRIREGVLSPWQKHITELARRDNVSCKLSGMATEASWTDWQPSDLVPYFETVLTAFGPERLLFGSDWPVVLVASEYSNWIATARTLVSRLSPDEQQEIMGGTATRIYNLRP